MTPLHIAALHGHLRIYKLIAKDLEVINPIEKHSMTPLHIAVGAKHLNVCKYIIQNVKDIHPEGISIQTPLQLAMEQEYSQVVQLYEEMDNKVYKKMSDTYLKRPN